MARQHVEDVLNLGLEQGYVTKSGRGTADRGPFELRSIERSPIAGSSYVDQYLPGRLGAGQELARLGGDAIARSYGGGVAHQEILEKLGIDDATVISFLKTFILGSLGNTRLHTPYSPPPIGDWEYLYEVLHRDRILIPVTVGLETIRYSGVLVFKHAFIVNQID